MTEVIFEENTTPETEPEPPLFEEETTSQEISSKWLNAVKEFLDELKFKTFVGIQNYSNDPNTSHSHPSTHELAAYMEQSKDTIQPRTSELKDKMLITEAGKRPCTCTECKHARREKGKPKISVTTWKIRQVTE